MSKYLFETTERLAKDFMQDVRRNNNIQARRLSNRKTGKFFIEISFSEKEVKKQ
jgi:hypothetical protein